MSMPFGSGSIFGRSDENYQPQKKWFDGLSARWGTSSNHRKARFYTLTAAGRKQLVRETTKWRRLTKAIARILGSEPVGG
jgi:hypothetical protein